MRDGAEPVTGVLFNLDGRGEVAAGYRKNTVIFRVAGEELLTEDEEVSSGEHIVLQNDAAFHMGEEPIDTRRDRISAPKVLCAVVLVNLTGPIDPSR
jgi:hypothetical protein